MCIRIHKQQIKRRNKYKKERKEKNCSKDNAKLYDTFDEIYKYACRMNKKKRTGKLLSVLCMWSTHI